MSDVVDCDIIIALAERVKVIEVGTKKSTWPGEEGKTLGPFPELQEYCPVLLDLIGVISTGGIHELVHTRDGEKQKFREAVDKAIPRPWNSTFNLVDILKALLK